ncbi:hypothetical protein K438DRAFT_1747516 [Mycena galopus ATCC 62051]|nr:hypothetical protein K438DRAFT_1747516 [Mycena galopus ATCC 62051]
MPSPGHIALVTGLASTSYFTFGNLGACYFGVMPAMGRGRTTLRLADRLALWDSFHGIAYVHMVASTVTAAVSLSVAGYLTSVGSLCNILAAGAVAGFAVVIYSVRFMLPLNDGLIVILRANSAPGKLMDMKQEQHVLDQLDKWRALRRVRVGLGIISWLAATTGLLASDSTIRLRF